MNDILCIELDLVETTGREPITAEGPMSKFSRTGRWSLLREDGLDLLRMDDQQRAAVLQTRKVFLTADAFTDFFGKETADAEADVVRV